MAEAKRRLGKFRTCVALVQTKTSGSYVLFLKAGDRTQSFSLENDEAYRQITAILESAGFVGMADEFEATIKIHTIIDSIPTQTAHFDNRGIFSTHYLKTRLFGDAVHATVEEARRLAQKSDLDTSAKTILGWLGWSVKDNVCRIKNTVSVIIEDSSSDLGIRTEDRAAPSYAAISELKNSRWVILTNGKHWRLYTSKVSASTTNYFEISLAGKDKDIIFRYLLALFHASSYTEDNGEVLIDTVFNRGKTYAEKLEEDLASKILKADGIFLDLVKGVLDHDMTRIFTADQLESAKESSLKIMYRIWFLLYAESRDLLPIKDARYRPISLQYLRTRLDGMEENPDDVTCWAALLDLFSGIRDGNPQRNLPQYNGGLFQDDHSIDSIAIRNKFLVPALRGLFEKDGEAMDYASLGVRHLGNIYEALMEFSIRQAESDIMLLEDSEGVTEVKSKIESSYSYKKNDLYLASKGRIVARKGSGSYYTPEEIVKFLVKRGLDPLFQEREKKVKNDLEQYKDNPSEQNYKKCIDRLLDIQVLDPAMGSGHFLVEALNRITSWAAAILQEHSSHPLVREMSDDRQAVLNAQKKNGIEIDENLLTDDVLLKRRVMKRCIFGTDINPLAVELSKLSLWLDSFAIGVPLTYMDHHMKVGDSTIGILHNELQDKDKTLDDWIEDSAESSAFIERVAHNADVTIQDLQDSRVNYDEYLKHIKPHKIVLDAIAASKMDGKIIPNGTKNPSAYLTRLAGVASGKFKMSNDIKKVIESINFQSSSHRFFHWVIEMMDAFSDERKGFDMITGNPPWDKVRPNKNEFFGNLVPGYKKKSDKEKQDIEEKYGDEFQVCKTRFDEMRKFYKERGGMGENTDFDLYRIVLDRMVEILAPNGVLSMVMPSAITNSRGATGLRKYFLAKNILSLFVFENADKIFDIDSRTRFALLTVQNTKAPKAFPSAFYLRKLSKLSAPKDIMIRLSPQQINKMSPKMSIIHEVRTDKDYKLLKKILSKHPRLEDLTSWSVDLGRELNMGEQKDKKLTTKKGGWPILESKNFHQHIHNFAKPIYTANVHKALKRTASVDKFHSKNKEIHQNPRLVYRSISSSTNTRTMIASIVPSSVFTTVNAYMAIPRVGTFDVNSDYHILNAYLCGIFNSTVYDYVVRSKVDKAVATYMLHDTPMPEDFRTDVAKQISKLSATLALAETWHDGMADAFRLTKSDVRDNSLKTRIEAVSKIDALAALQFGLTRQEYKHILTTFKYDDEPFTQDELFQQFDYRKLSDGERNKHMKKFYGQVYGRVLGYFDQYSKKSAVSGLVLGEAKLHD